MAQTLLYAGLDLPTPEEFSRASGSMVVSDSRSLTAAVERYASDSEVIVVIPAGTDRDLTSITQVAQTLQWLSRTGAQVALGKSLCNATYHIARLRAHIRAASQEGADAVLFIAQAVDPFADAELCRRVRLAQQYSESVEIALAFEARVPVKADVFPEVEETMDRLHLLGCHEIVKVRADLGVNVPDQRNLFAWSGLNAAMKKSVEEAEHMLSHGVNGIEAGLWADHDTGFAHSHGNEDTEGTEGHSHTHAHPHTHSHPHPHPHTHAHLHSHTH